MKEYIPNFTAQEQMESDCPNFRGGKSKRLANKAFRKSGKNLKNFDPETICTANYKQRTCYEL